MRRPRFELAALAEILPLSLIQAVLRETEREAKRVRKLPPELVTWLVVGMGLFRNLSVANVLQRVASSLGDAVGWGPAELPHTTSISHARDRLGWTTVRSLFRRLAARLGRLHAKLNTWRGLVVLTVDGTTFLAPDTPANEETFGRAGSNRGGPSAFPQFRAVVVMGAWTHLIVDAVFGCYRTNETKLAEGLLDRFCANSLLVLDRGYFAFSWLHALSSRNVEFLVRAKKGRCALKLKRRQKLATGDWLGAIKTPPYLRRRDPGLPRVLTVRILTYRYRGRWITVVTSLLDPNRYPAREIAALYQDRWEAELGYRELKIHMGQSRVIFRSHRPDRVLQEAYGLLIAYDCVRALMCQAGEEAGVSPIRLSFMDCLERVRWALRAGGDQALQDLVFELARCLLQPKRVGRSCDRAVKIKMSNYPRKRPGQRAGPTPYQRQRKARQHRA